MLFSLPIHTLAFAGSVATTSYVLFSNVANAQMGIIPLLNGKLGAHDISTQGKVQGWNAYFPVAMRWGIAPSVASAALSFTTAYIHPRPQVRRLALLSGIASLLVGPITFAVGLPAINSQLLDLGTRSVKGQMTQADWSTKAALVDRLISDWESKHTIRFVSYVGGWAFSFAALLLAL